MKKALIGAVLAATFVLSMSFGSVALAGPQPLPAAACNQGTQHARTLVENPEHIAHYHDFDHDGVLACYHFNLTYPPPPPGFE